MRAMKMRFKNEFEHMQSTGRRVLVIDDLPSIELLVQERLKLRKVPAETVVQLIDSDPADKRLRPYIYRAMIGAVPLAEGRIVVAGSQNRIPNTQQVTIEKLVSLSFQALKAIKHSA